MSRERVLACVFTCCPPGTDGFKGGEDTLGWNLLRQIARFHEVWAITNSDARQSIEQITKKESVTNINFCYVGLPNWMKPLLGFQGGHQFYYYIWQIKAYFVSRALHHQVRFGLFHHITYANDWMTSFMGALLPIRYVRGPGGGAHRTPKSLEKEYMLKGRIWEKIRSISQWIFKHDPMFVLGQSRAGAILVCNRESISKMPRRWVNKVHFFPVSGVSTHDLSLANSPKPRNTKFQVLSAGSLIRVKGFGIALKAFKEFTNKYPESEFSIIGSGPEQSQIEATIHDLNISSKVFLKQSMPRLELLSEMATCDVFLFPSLRDGGGTVVIEAMAMSKPVICLDTGGPGMHINDDCGVKISTHSSGHVVSDISKALERLYLDEPLRVRLGEAGRNRAERIYHWDRLGDQLKDIYESVLQPEEQE